MYQKAADVIAEFVANAWDADATQVDITIDDTTKTITVCDNGDGMTYNECQNKYLQVGRDRRKSLQTDLTRRQRKVMGRKGIGKFAGFGISSSIHVKSISKSTDSTLDYPDEAPNVATEFILNLDDFESNSHIEKHEIETLRADSPTNESCGTSITLNKVSANLSDVAINEITKGLARRFLQTENNADFVITVNKNPAKILFNENKEFIFPRDLSDEEKQKFNLDNIEQAEDGDWAVTSIPNFGQVKWRIAFTEETIKEVEMRGIAIFARNKLAQKPFFFKRVGIIKFQADKV